MKYYYLHLLIKTLQSLIKLTYILLTFYLHFTYILLAMSASLVLQFGTGRIDSHLSDPNSFVVPSVEREDYEKAQEFGILTPRHIIPSDHTTAITTPTWKDIITNSKKNTTTKDIEFLLFQAKQENDAHEDILDDLVDLWEQDINQSYYPGHTIVGNMQLIYLTPKELIPLTTNNTTVRIAFKKNGFAIGSISGQTPNVYIPPFIAKDLDIHSFYSMNLTFKPQSTNLWCANSVNEKYHTPAMMINQIIINEKTLSSFKVPADPKNIGIIIGKNGKNINGIIDHINKNTQNHTTNDEYSKPEVTISTIDENFIQVDVLCSALSLWKHEHIVKLISFMHT